MCLSARTSASSSSAPAGRHDRSRGFQPTVTACSQDGVAERRLKTGTDGYAAQARITSPPFHRRDATPSFIRRPPRGLKPTATIGLSLRDGEIPAPASPPHTHLHHHVPVRFRRGRGGSCRAARRKAAQPQHLPQEGPHSVSSEKTHAARIARCRPRQIHWRYNLAHPCNMAIRTLTAQIAIRPHAIRRRRITSNRPRPPSNAVPGSGTAAQFKYCDPPTFVTENAPSVV